MDDTEQEMQMVSWRAKSTFKSIPAGFNLETPRFSIIIGKNGSGKTHLLQAIASSFDNLHPYSSNLTGNTRDIISEFTTRFEKESFKASRQVKIKEFKRKLDSLHEKIESGKQLDIASAAHSMSQMRYEKDDTLDAITYIIQTNRDPTNASQEEILQALDRVHPTKTQSGAQEFGRYAFLKTEQLLNQFLYDKGITPEVPLSDDEFANHYGEPPWLNFDRRLSLVGLPYTVEPPKIGDPFYTYNLMLRHNRTASLIEVPSLSEGEKVLFELACHLPDVETAAGKSSFLLLDEMDAPLHPENCKILIDTAHKISEAMPTLNVILTTHSPITVALCPENSIFEIDMEAKCTRKIDKDHALNILTAGLENFTITTSSVRQVYPEGKDAKIFSAIFKRLELKKPFNFSAIFLETGGQANKETVEKITHTLNEAGNNLARGIIDRDTDNKSRGPIIVLGGNRYAIENYILDPLIMALVTADFDKATPFAHLNCDQDIAITEVNNLENSTLQYLANEVLLKTGIKIENLTCCPLENGKCIDLPDAFLNLNGHEWAKKLADKFTEELRRPMKGHVSDTEMMEKLIHRISSFSGFISVDVRRTFELLK